MQSTHTYDLLALMSPTQHWLPLNKSPIPTPINALHLFDAKNNISTISHRPGMKVSDKDKEMEKEVHQLREELEDQKARAEAYLLQLRDGAKYVQTMQEQLDEVCTIYCNTIE